MNNKEKIKQLENEYFELMYNMVADGEMSFVDHYRFTKQGDEVVQSAYTSRPDYISKEFVDKDFATACYQDVLETDAHFEDIMTLHAEQEEKSEEWLAEVRLNKCHASKEIVNDFKEHPVQLAMTKSKRFIPSQAINKRSFRSMLGYTQESVNQWKEFEQSLANSEVLDEVKAELESTKWDVQRLNNTLELAPVDKKEKALYLIDKGYSHQRVADIVGVNKKTVTRWCKPK